MDFLTPYSSWIGLAGVMCLMGCAALGFHAACGGEFILATMSESSPGYQDKVRRCILQWTLAKCGMALGTTLMMLCLAIQKGWL